jgi:hypothetical protein
VGAWCVDEEQADISGMLMVRFQVAGLVNSKLEIKN